MSLKVLLCSVVHILLDLVEKLSNLCSNICNCTLDLFSCVTSYKYTLTCLKILRSDLDTYRNSSHLLLRELEARSSVCIVSLYSEG